MSRLVCMALLASMVAACDDTEFNSVGGGSGDYDASAEGVVALMHDHCTECHPALQPSFETATLLDDVESGEGRFVVAGDREASLMWIRLTDPNLPPMPPTGLLPAEMIEPIGVWIDDGAPLFDDEGGAE